MVMQKFGLVMRKFKSFEIIQKRDDSGPIVDVRGKQ